MGKPHQVDLGRDQGRRARRLGSRDQQAAGRHAVTREITEETEETDSHGGAEKRRRTESEPRRSRSAAAVRLAAEGGLQRWRAMRADQSNGPPFVSVSPLLRVNPFAPPPPLPQRIDRPRPHLEMLGPLALLAG